MPALLLTVTRPAITLETMRTVLLLTMIRSPNCGAAVMSWIYGIGPYLFIQAVAWMLAERLG